MQKSTQTRTSNGKWMELLAWEALIWLTFLIFSGAQPLVVSMQFADKAPLRNWWRVTSAITSSVLGVRRPSTRARHAKKLANGVYLAKTFVSYYGRDSIPKHALNVKCAHYSLPIDLMAHHLPLPRLESKSTEDVRGWQPKLCSAANIIFQATILVVWIASMSFVGNACKSTLFASPSQPETRKFLTPPFFLKPHPELTLWRLSMHYVRKLASCVLRQNICNQSDAESPPASISIKFGFGLFFRWRRFRNCN